MSAHDIALAVVEYLLDWLLPLVFSLRSKLRFRRLKRPRPEGMVIVHHPGRGPWAPSMIPFAVKIETYLRMAKIPYKVLPGLAVSPKNKFPWIEHNGSIIGDSSIIIKYLNKTYKINLNKHLNPEQRAIARGFRVMGEEHAYWTGFCYRWSINYDQELMTKAMGFPHSVVTWYISRKMIKLAWAQGMGRHSHQEIREMMLEDLQSISDMIGKKKFLMGDIPCEEDCAVFGILSQIRWDMPGTGEVRLVEEEFPNISNYGDRMKEMFWPDWDDCITWGGTRAATK